MVGATHVPGAGVVRRTVAPAEHRPAVAIQEEIPAEAGPSAAGVLEKLVSPIVDSDYSTRKGYAENFLGEPVPLPTVKDTSVVAKMDNGKHVIPYEHFSVIVHKQRRLALLTASNVEGNTADRAPEPGDYGRDSLGGLGPNDQEKWVTDPRIPELHQLPDKFYNKDGGAFDKGHIVRREDVNWGRSYDQIQRANGDTFHTTNCSPQVKGFNRSPGRWGALENDVLSQAKGKPKDGVSQRFCLFAGPWCSGNEIASSLAWTIAARSGCRSLRSSGRWSLPPARVGCRRTPSCWSKA